MSLLHQDVDFKLLLMRASIWKQGRAASIVATGQLCCSTPSKLVQEHAWATVGWLWDKIVVAALAFSPLHNYLFAHYLVVGHLGTVFLKLDW